ncbi:MAG: hypothetical protein ACOYMD_09340 [Paludibacter sp.]
MKSDRYEQPKNNQKTNMKIYKEDIACIADYPELNEKGNLDLIAFYPGTNSDEILLREILLEFGEYRIVEQICYEDEFCYRTNLPYELYQQACDNYEIISKRREVISDRNNLDF